jgi:hypothetical protein
MLHHKIVPTEKVDLLREAIRNYRTVQELPGHRERKSALIIVEDREPTSGEGRRTGLRKLPPRSA